MKCEQHTVALDDGQVDAEDPAHEVEESVIEMLAGKEEPSSPEKNERQCRRENKTNRQH